ncbi:MAG: 23S rRNA (guanosine(2251)-2'-O)-methyltransferase RlmB [Hyphomicrobium zavarzinii]|uniref:23S rRNA (guanosine(2251)-2'-O)-methyltransferase RlmB n=1 Tax=Hyphomicrobium zavarzinii TaxID=48292 RepID=UPI001A4559A8|nr:23S rRNA (guanosine(2251)-2'-O)-methyltransferase RlmB [Hyphomicrobium zavarzinii]MBL8847405.1 23S rRNA (guanosine(2251)-2'-O)-methyltransferase RlmB [Hyphomicrobium zavarzinii]
MTSGWAGKKSAKKGGFGRPAKGGDRRASRPRGQAPGGRAAEIADDGMVRLFGSHAVEAALNNPRRRVLRLLATENAERRLADVIAARGVPIDRATPGDLDHLLGADTVHQGLLLEAEPLPEPTLEELVKRAAETGPLVLLDHVTDPHNGGAVLRSAAAFGAAGVVMTRRHSPPLNGVLAKAASGALDLLPVLPVQNLARTMLELKGLGFRLIGLEGSATDRLESERFEGLTALVLGAEGKGLRELTQQTCDRLVSITTGGPLASLNVSNAAAVALHWAAYARRSHSG